MKAATKKTEKAIAPPKEAANPKIGAKEEKPKAEKKDVKKKEDEEGVKIKKPLSAYFLFMAEMRDKVKKENQDLKAKDILKVKEFLTPKQLGKMWGDIDEAGKKKYLDLAEKEKKRYDDEVQAAGGKKAQKKEPASRKVKQAASKDESKIY